MHGDIQTNEQARKLTHEFRQIWGSCIEEEPETAEDRAAYRLWHWQSYGGTKPPDAPPDASEYAAPDADDEEFAPIDEPEDEDDAALDEPPAPAASRAPPTLALPGRKRFKAVVDRATSSKSAALQPPVTLAGKKVAPTTLAVRNPSAFAIPDGYALVPLRQIAGLRDTVRRTRQSATQMLQVAESALTVIDGIREQYQNEKEILDSQEQAISEFLFEHHTS